MERDAEREEISGPAPEPEQGGEAGEGKPEWEFKVEYEIEDFFDNAERRGGAYKLSDYKGLSENVCRIVRSLLASERENAGKEIKQGTLYGFDLVLKVPADYKEDNIINERTLGKYIDVVRRFEREEAIALEAIRKAP